MKKTILLAASLLALNLTPVFGQPAPILPPTPITPQSAPQFPLPPTTPAADNYQQRLQAIINAANPQQKPTPELTKFNLDFPGGTPKELVAAIEKATGKPLNTIIPDEDADTKLPPLKLNEITFPQLNDTLRVGTHKEERTPGGGFRSYGDIYFKTVDNSPSDSTVWFFAVDKPYTPPPVEKVCQFYSLSPYLDRGFTVDDITTAIQTGWKMAGVTPTPALNYHKETKLLIAFGEPNKLQTIQQVLQTLPSVNQEFWRQANDRIRELQTQVVQLKKQLNPPPPVVPGLHTSPEAQEKSGK